VLSRPASVEALCPVHGCFPTTDVCRRPWWIWPVDPGIALSAALYDAARVTVAYRRGSGGVRG
jgi:hypothetical protein